MDTEPCSKWLEGSQGPDELGKEASLEYAKDGGKVSVPNYMEEPAPSVAFGCPRMFPKR